MKKRLIMGMLASVLVLASGCSLRPSINEDQPTKPAASDNDVSDNDAKEATDDAAGTQTAETTQPQIVQIEVPETKDDHHAHETVPIEELEEPVDENGVWTDYILATDVLDAEWEAPAFGEHGSRFYVEDYPVIFVSDSKKEEEINAVVHQYVENNYSNRFQIQDIDIALTCSVLSATRFVSYQFEGQIRHIGDDVRYEDEREYRYYFTIDRMTGQVINLETAIGLDTVYEEISKGHYEVIRAEDSVFERFPDDLLADVYINEPMFPDDTAHELDFYIQDGYVYVVIWVGEENGSYAILRLYQESNIQ